MVTKSTNLLEVARYKSGCWECTMPKEVEGTCKDFEGDNFSICADLILFLSKIAREMIWADLLKVFLHGYPRAEILFLWM